MGKKATNTDVLIKGKGNTSIKETTTQLSDNAKIVNGKNLELGIAAEYMGAGSKKVEAASGSMVFTDVTGNVNTGVSIGDNSAYHVQSMDKNTASLFNTFANIIQQNQAETFENARGPGFVTTPTLPTDPGGVTLDTDIDTEPKQRSKVSIMILIVLAGGAFMFFNRKKK